MILWIAVGTSGFAQQKNILYLRFEQKHISRALAIAPDSVFSVYYRLSCPKPFDFHGIQVDFAYDKTILQPVDKGVIIEGSASANAEYAFSGVSSQDGTNNIAILGSQQFDTSNHLLFRYRATVLTSASIDSAAIAVFLISTGNNSGIDSVVIENSGGRDEVGYYPFAIAYLDSVKIIHQKHQVTLSSDTLFIPSDSTKALSIVIDSIPVVNIQNALFTMHYDTSRIQVVSIDKGEIIGTATAASLIAGDSCLLGFSSERLSRSGEFLRLNIKAKHIPDTVATTLIDPKLLVTNAEDSISTVLYDLKPIVILGHQDSIVDTTHSSVSIADRAIGISIVEEAGMLRVGGLSSSINKVTIYSIIGTMIATATPYDGVARLSLPPSGGTYILRAECLKNPGSQISKKFIIH